MTDDQAEARIMEFCLHGTGHKQTYWGVFCWFLEGGRFYAALRFWRQIWMRQ